MDVSVHSSAPPNSRKRSRESETESQRIKREKAAERQRRKRERDRKAALQQQAQQQQAQQMQQQQMVPPQPIMPQQSVPPPQQQEYAPQEPQELSPDELMRREKVRAAARERQRKHRLLVKQKRMRDLGLDMGNEILSGMDEMSYRPPPPPPEAQYHQVLPPELQQLAPPPPHALPPPPHEPPFPQNQQLGGQTFASTLLLSFSCAPLLKQHLLRTLSMTNEELASLEPVIAEAWDRWDHGRRMHYAEMAKNGNPPPPHLQPPYTLEMAQHDPHQPPPHPFPHPNGPGPADPNQAAAANEFRARFHRSIVGPTPFRTSFPDPQVSTPTTAPSSTTGSAPNDSIDPHLASSSGSTTEGGKNEDPSVLNG